MYLTVLSGILQHDVVEAILERLQLQLDGSHWDILEELYDYEVLIELLNSKHDNILVLVTNMLLHIVQEGNIWFTKTTHSLLIF